MAEDPESAALQIETTQTVSVNAFEPIVVNADGTRGVMHEASGARSSLEPSEMHRDPSKADVAATHPHTVDKSAD